MKKESAFETRAREIAELEQLEKTCTDLDMAVSIDQQVLRLKQQQATAAQPQPADTYWKRFYDCYFAPLPKAEKVAPIQEDGMSVLNGRQVRALWCGILFAVAVLLLPPWKEGMGTYGRSYSTGYAFLFTPPVLATGIDVQRIALELAVVTLLTVAAMATYARRRVAE